MKTKYKSICHDGCYIDIKKWGFDYIIKISTTIPMLHEENKDMLNNFLIALLWDFHEKNKQKKIRVKKKNNG